jgi:hypothetical protein
MEEKQQIPSEIGDGPTGATRPPELDGKAAIATPENLRTLEEFIVAIYVGKNRKRLLKPASVGAVVGTPALPEAVYASLAPILASDAALAISFELLLLLPRLRGNVPLRAGLREFIGRGLRLHPMFQSPELQAVLSNQPNALSPRSALRMLAIASRAITGPGTTSGKRKTTKVNASAIANLALWMHETRDYSIETMIRDLHAVVWDSAADRLRDDLSQARALLEKPSTAGMGIIGRTFARIAEEQRNAAETSRRIEAETRVRSDAVALELDRVQAMLTAREARILELEENERLVRERHAVELSHAVDDEARLRGRLVRVLREESAMLDAGLHALRRDPPKTAVMDDHAERVVTTLKRELEHLESGGRDGSDRI